MNSFSYVLLCAGVVSDYTNGELDYISEVADILFDIHTPHTESLYISTFIEHVLLLEWTSILVNKQAFFCYR